MGIRLDSFLVTEGYFESREKAKSAIMAGNIYIKGQKIDKAGYQIKDADIERLEVRGAKLPYVSRGGLKLAKAIAEYGLDLSGKVCMDIGASTGGFTDCMIQNGGELVYAVDVGYGQLDWKLRNHDRVLNMERTNIRNVTSDDLKQSLEESQIDLGFRDPEFISIDVSFISLNLVLPVAVKLLKDDGELVYLIKPQFEAGKEQVGKNGVVRSHKVHEAVLNNIVKLSTDLKLQIKALTFSPIKGPKGNIEFLMYSEKINGEADNEKFDDQVIKDLVSKAHEELTL